MVIQKNKNVSLPGGAIDLARRQHVSMRLRMLTGRWMGDLESAMSRYFSTLRKAVIGQRDLSTNIFKNVVGQLAGLYDRDGRVRGETPEAEQEMAKILQRVGWWSLAQRNNQLALGLRENMTVPYYDPRRKVIDFRLVTPDLVYAEQSPADPSQPVFLVEARERWIIRKGKRAKTMTWDVYDIRDEENASFAIKVAPDGLPDEINYGALDDVTSEVLKLDTMPAGGMAGSSYPWVYEDGDPYIPHEVYHALRPLHLWDAFEGREMVEGSLTVAVLWSWWVHLVRDCTWSSRHTIDIQPLGRSTKGGADILEDEPTFITQFKSVGDKQGQAGQWDPPVDPKDIGEALTDFERRLSIHYGVSPSDILRTQQARSGYAIALEKSAIRDVIEKYVPMFRQSDNNLMRKIANISNRERATNLPETGWNIEYAGMAKSPAEIEARLNEINTQVQHGLMSRVDAYLELHPGLTREEAVEQLTRVDQENKLFGATPRIGG